MRRASLCEGIRALTLTALVVVSAAAAGSAQVTLVNMVPAGRSGETNQDSEPSITVNPSAPNQIAATAFTWDNLTGGNPGPGHNMLGANAPIYVSEDGGQTWSLAFNIPSAVGSTFPTGDIQPRFSNMSVGTTNLLYTGILHAPEFSMRVFRSTDFRLSVPMTLLDTRTNNVDQPHVRAATVLGGPDQGRDRLYVGFNNGWGGVAPKTASVDFSLDAAIASPTFNVRLLETRDTGSAGQDGFANVPAVHADGTIYVVFYGFRSNVAAGRTSDVVVVRDDNWATGATPFTALTDPADTLPGMRVVTGRTVGFGSLGQQRLGASNLAIAVDPRDSRRVYISWGELPSGAAVATQELHVRRSIDQGATWSGDLLVISDAVNPGLAINSQGRVAVLYQRHVGTSPSDRWETHLTRSTDADATSFDDPGLLLANTPASSPASTFQPYIGDYAGLIAYGKNFYGIFSANNTPDTANFFASVQYQRFANWASHTLFTSAAMTTSVPASIDPFFFQVTEAAPSEDFYVRDWTDNPASGDNGAEPSTHGVFYATSDVWNRRGTLPGSFVNDQPENEDAGNGAGNIGDNWAFARIRRNALPASGSKDVTAHFLVSKLGTGSSYVDAGLADPDLSFPDPDPVVTFTAAELGPKLTTPYHWHLNAISSNHLCLAVEISAPGDPFQAPSLAGMAPGWPTTDLRVINDNNKAQRNMHLSTTPARGPGGRIGSYAIAHNAATYVRDMVLRYEVAPSILDRLGNAQIIIVGGNPVPIRRSGTITLARMQPGENRWVGVAFDAPEGKEGELLPVDFHEMVGATPVNGFRLAAQLSSYTRVIRQVLEDHRAQFTRLAAGGFKIPGLEEEIGATQKLLHYKEISESIYLDFLRPRPRTLEAALRALTDSSLRDPFDATESLKALAIAIDSGAPGRAAVAHLTYLNQLDSFLTMRQLEHGDPADILQNVRWQKDLYTRLPQLHPLGCSSTVLTASQNFILTYGMRKATNSDYPGLVKRLLRCYRETAQLPDLVNLGLARSVDAMANALGNPTALQREHRDFLVKLQTLER